VFSQTTNEEVHEIFCSRPDLFSLPVVDDEVPVGMITRSSVVDKLARPYYRELYGKKSCASFMDENPLIVDHKTTIHELSRKVVAAGRLFLINGYIITDNGKYCGVGTGHDLMKKVTEMQIDAARYANPLTQLPGNVPLHQEIDKMIEQQICFVCVYCDLDNFKPFNDCYGFERGDSVIMMVGEILSSIIDQDLDFLGHIGGDDFICLFRSEDWELRSRRVLEKFDKESQKYFSKEDLKAGGYYAEDRRGKNVFHPLMKISLGAIRVDPDYIHSHKELSGIAAEAKKMAKKISGNSLYIDRRLRSYRKARIKKNTLAC
jgi:GGDEF domain-containing protein